MKKIVCAIMTLAMLISFSAVNAATPKSSPEETVLAYAEMYSLGTSEHLAATGIPKDITDAIEKDVTSHLMTAFMNYPMTKNNFQNVKEKYFAKLHEIIKISARLKKNDDVNPIVEITATNVDQEVADKIKAEDANFLTMDVMNHLSSAEELAADGQYQGLAINSIGNVIKGLTATAPKTYDVTCEIVTDDGGNSYWKPSNVQGLFDFVMIDFAIKEVDPQTIDGMLATVFSTETEVKKESQNNQ